MNYEKSGMGFKIPRNLDETNESYEKRKWFIGTYAPKTPKEFDKAVQLSNIWVNMLYLKCRYPDKTEKEIANVIKKSANFNKYVKVKVKKPQNK